VLARGLEAAGLAMERRALRLMPRDLVSEWQGDDLRLGFGLTKGAFATTVLREIMGCDVMHGDPAMAMQAPARERPGNED
jgi:tRNA pseudouridine13 synthase